MRNTLLQKKFTKSTLSSPPRALVGIIVEAKGAGDSSGGDLVPLKVTEDIKTIAIKITDLR